MSLEITGSLKESLRKLYFRASCAQRGWAYADLQDIHDNMLVLKGDNAVVFQKGEDSLQIKIMQQLVPEIVDICQLGRAARAAPNFDYLACNVKNVKSEIIVASPEALCWVILRTGRGIFSESQVEALSKITLPIALFQIRDVLAAPRKLETKWDIRSGSQWLDMLDEKKEQEEYDDEYF